MRIRCRTFMSKYITQDLYNLAFCLIPDDLQASQLVLDAFRAILLENNIAAEFYLSAKKTFSKSSKNSSEYKLLLKKIYQMAQIRISQISVNMNDGSVFYKLTLEERAILVLRHRFKMSLNNIAYITNMAKVETINRLFLARTSVINF